MPVSQSSAPESALSPEQALSAYQKRTQRQLVTLTRCSDDTTIDAEIPALSEKGEFLLKRTFSAPQSLVYTAVNFVGDSFVKNNVIYRWMQSDVDRVEKGTRAKIVILESNYKISYKGIEYLNGRPLYAFALHPRRKEPGLFKGKILIEPATGHIVRAMGRLSKSPSWWIKRVDFTQDYADVGEFTMPTETQSVTQARFVGRVVVNIRHSGYEVQSVDPLQPAHDEASDPNGCCQAERSHKASLVNAE